MNAKLLQRCSDASLATMVLADTKYVPLQAKAKAIIMGPMFPGPDAVRDQWIDASCDWQNWRGEKARAVKAEVKLRYDLSL